MKQFPMHLGTGPIDWSERDEVLLATWNTLPGTEIADALGVSYRSVQKRARQLGLPPALRYPASGDDSLKDCPRRIADATRRLEQAYVAWARRTGRRVFEYK